MREKIKSNISDPADYFGVDEIYWDAKFHCDVCNSERFEWKRYMKSGPALCFDCVADSRHPARWQSGFNYHDIEALNGASAMIKILENNCVGR